MSRLEQLKTMLANDPDDAFLNYALALEYDKLEQHDDSLDIFARLVQYDPPYVPAFFMAAQQLADLDRIDQARGYLREGIEQARGQGDSHAAAEMSEFLTSLGERGEL